jgi:hypothetical protein
MLPKARLLSAGTPVEVFDWIDRPKAPAPELLAAFDVPTAATAPPPPPAADPPGADAPAPGVGPEPITADQQAHLAALERDAFIKGYAQGERAGLEAGGKRAEAMLRRVAQTLEELGGFRQTLIQQTERQMVQLALTLARRVVHRRIASSAGILGDSAGL